MKDKRISFSLMHPEFMRIWQGNIQYCEQQFERDIADFPYEVELPLVNDLFDGMSNSAMLDYCDQIIDYLSKNFAAGSYIVFPESAAGKYVSKANSVFFKQKTDAILFKLSV